MVKEITHHKVRKRISEDLGPLRGDRRIMVLDRPGSGIYIEAFVHGGENGRLLKDPMQHGKAIAQSALAEAESIHEAGGKDRGVSGVAKA